MATHPTFQDYAYDKDDRRDEDYDYDFDNIPHVSDDNVFNININKHIQQMVDSITRIGGEVCRLRAEVDGLLEQNHSLTDTFKRLKEVLDEKGVLDTDDFQLACDVFDESNHTKNSNSPFFKRTTH